MTAANLKSCLANMARELSPDGASTVAEAVTKAGSPAALRSRCDTLPTVRQQKLAAELADSWAESGSEGAAAVGLALIVSQAAAERQRLAETVDLVWTGPKSTDVPVARNSEALLELVTSAQRELLIVSYATYQMPDLVQKLADAVDRGVDVTMVLEFHGSVADQPQTWDPVAGLGGHLHAGVKLYGWPLELRDKTDWGKVGYLHVKCAVADQQIAFVSSANLTVYAMEMNMELGVVVRGGEVPRRIAEHFSALIADGTLERRE